MKHFGVLKILLFWMDRYIDGDVDKIYVHRHTMDINGFFDEW